MPESDLRIQMEEWQVRLSRQIAKESRDTRNSLMLVVVFWAMVGSFAQKIDDFGTFMMIVGALALCGYIGWHVRYGRRDQESSGAQGSSRGAPG